MKEQKKVLGHMSIHTTDIYARADSKAKREALEKANVDLTPMSSPTAFGSASRTSASV